jgi:hypothetical protein
VIHPDTSFLIRALVTRSSHDRKLGRWLSEGASVGIGAIGWAEFLCGPVEPSQAALAARFLGEPVSFTAEDSKLSARLFNLSEAGAARFQTAWSRPPLFASTPPWRRRTSSTLRGSSPQA